MHGDNYRYPQTDGFSLFPPAVTDFARDYDQLFWYITLVIVVGMLGTFAVIAASCFLFARQGPDHRTPRILGSTKVEIAWTVLPFFFFMTFVVWGYRLYDVQVQAPADAPEIFVVGKQWMWKIQHPDGQREMNELHLPVDTAVRVTGTSEDVIHDFGIPAFRSKFDVMPGRYFTTWYKPVETGTFHIFCDQYCGMGHSQMIGKVHVLSQADFEAWKEGTFEVHNRKEILDGSPAWDGRKLFLKLQCNACHNPNPAARAPRLEGMWGTVRPIQGGGQQKFDAEYARQSIRNPLAKVADGWKPIMPAYPVSQVDEIELRNLVAYIKSLKPGDLPSRNENYPAPVNAPGAPTSEGGLSR